MTTTSHVLFFDSINIWNLEGLGLLRLALIATEKKKRGKIEEPAVIGAVLHLWYCCDFLDKRCIRVEYAEAFLQANKLNLEVSEGFRLFGRKYLSRNKIKRSAGKCYARKKTRWTYA